MTQHLSENVLVLLRKYPKAGVVLAGDANKMDISQVTKSIPHLRQIVSKPTHIGGILDVILTNLQPKYSVPFIRPPVKPDCDKAVKPSDHNYAITVPKNNQNGSNSREYQLITCQPTPYSARRYFGQMLL